MGWLSGWGKRIGITISNTNVDSGLSNFPVLIYLSASSGTGNDDVSAVFDELTSDANRKKIAITSSDGETELYVEIERWDDANEKAWLWVKVPTVSDSAGTVLYFYFDVDHADNTNYVGDTGDTPAKSVWDSDFVGVWHMAQDPNGDPANGIKDSTSNSYHGTPIGGMTSADLVDGLIGKAIEFDGGNDRIATTCPGISGAGDRTVEVIAHVAPTASSGALVFWGWTSLANGTKWSVTLDVTGGALRTEVQGGNLVATTQVDDSAWHYCVSVFSGDNVDDVICYLDGSVDGESSHGSLAVNTGTDYNVYFAVQLSQASVWNCFPAKICEVRISSAVRSAAWIKATHYGNTDALVAFGSMEYGLSAASSAYALTGQDVTLTYSGGYILSVEGGSYALTGQDVTLTAGYELVVEGGSYVLSGTAVDFRRDYLLASGAGVYNLTGMTAALLKDYPMPAGAGSYTLVGASAELAFLIAVINLASPIALEIELDSELAIEIELSSLIADEINLDSYLIK